MPSKALGYTNKYSRLFSNYTHNSSPTWAEALAMLLVMYVTALGVAVGVRDAGHIGLESIVSLLPESWRLKLELSFTCVWQLLAC